MTLTIIFILALLITWRISHQRKGKAHHAAWLAENKQEAQRLVAAGQLTVKEAEWRVRQEQPMPLYRHLGSGSFVPAPHHDAGGGYVQESGPSGADLLFEQMEEQRRLEGIRRREDEAEQYWRDEENHRREQDCQREGEYWAQRVRDDY